MAFREKTYTASGVVISVVFSDDIAADLNETYKSAPLISAMVDMQRLDVLSAKQISMNYFNYETLPGNEGRCCFVYNSENNVTIANFNNTATCDYELVDEEYPQSPYTYLNQSSFCATTANANVGIISFSTNIPVFETQAEADAYMYAPTQEDALLALALAINVLEESVLQSDMFWYQGEHGSIEYNEGAYKLNENGPIRSLIFQTSEYPRFYINENNPFEMTLLVGSCIRSITSEGFLDPLMEENPVEWPLGPSIQYSGPFYCLPENYESLTGLIPDAGIYPANLNFKTNIDIYGNLADAIEGDPSKAIPGGGGDPYHPPTFGDPEERTEFGDGGFLSPFGRVWIMSKTQLQDVKNEIYNPNESGREALLKGLDMFGTNPMNCIINLRAYPFDVTRITGPNYISQQTMFLGAYSFQLSSAAKIVNELPARYLDAGSVRLTPVQGNYKDFEPYSSLSLWLPFCGWQKLDPEKYYNKTVNIRYYVDIMTGQAEVATVCDGIMTDIFGPFQIGTDLPICGINYAEYAASMTRLITGGIQSGANALMGGGIPGAVVGAVSQVGELMTTKQPRSLGETKGGYSSGIGNYLPGYVIFKYEIHEMLEPSLLNSLYGRPSYSSGLVRNFSGFLKGNVTRLNKAGMSESEAEAISSLLSKGVYI